ncbi:MAG: discoidin domain-containing protein [Prevotellaceae bacterium]|jgi:hypothetical protein|nr:discoidin domain-containing protein [Prevotellaceae bacterium]
MKRIIYFLTIMMLPALYSCSNQYDNIDQYATDETVYIGTFYEYPSVKIGYNRVEIDLLQYFPLEYWYVDDIRDLINTIPGTTSVYRPSPDEIYMGKARKTIVEYYEGDELRRIVFDSVCSWVNIENLTSSKIYVFTIYSEDEFGNKSVPVEATGRPFTDEELAGYAFPLPYTIATPSTMDFRWGDSISSSIYKFVDLDYSYTDRNDSLRKGKLTSDVRPSFSVNELGTGNVVPIKVRCRLIPLIEDVNGVRIPIIDTVVMERMFDAKTATAEEYINARALRPIQSALLDENNLTRATVKWNGTSDHLAWTEVRYQLLDGTWTVLRVDNRQGETVCENVMRGVAFQIRCAYTPPGTTDEYISEWTNHMTPFLLEYNRRDWTAVSRGRFHPWGDDNAGPEWVGGHPMTVFDGNFQSGWHTRLGTPFPQYLLIDMKSTKTVSKVVVGNKSDEDGYWNHLELYVTDDLSIPGYTPYTVDWDEDPTLRQDRFLTWHHDMANNHLPGEIPASWGAPVAQVQVKKYGSHTFDLAQYKAGRYLIVLFPDNKITYGTYINVREVNVFGD